MYVRSHSGLISRQLIKPSSLKRLTVLSALLFHSQEQKTLKAALVFSSHVGINLDGNQHIGNRSYGQILVLFNWCKPGSFPPKVVEGRGGPYAIPYTACFCHQSYGWLLSIQIFVDPRDMNPTVVFVPPEGICLQCVIAVFLPHMPRDTIHKLVKVETQCNQLLSDEGFITKLSRVEEALSWAVSSPSQVRDWMREGRSLSLLPVHCGLGH